MGKPIMETKDFKFTLAELDEKAGSFTGYASIWNDVDSYGDQVVKGAFKRTLKARKAFPMLWSHSMMEPIGVIKGQEDEVGLAVEGQLNLEVQRAREVRSLMVQMKEAGAPMGLSFGYQTITEEIDAVSKTRRLKEIKLYEISPVVFPACDPARIAGVKGEGAEDEDGHGVYCEACKRLIEEGPGDPTPPEKAAGIEASPESIHLAEKIRDQIAELFHKEVAL